MRPHLLTIEAMGPYAGTETVAFDALAQEGLFLIHGPTGSGKTFLFDALCFALYGEVPGARGDRGLLSHHAPAGATPRVSLEFTAQGGRYRVVREPYHEAAKKRGAGTTVRPTATLERLDPGHQATLATKPTEVKAEVVRLVGLSATQFQQVILLPQGQFEAVLRGKPETREALLETLFHTTGFDHLTEWLLQEARAKRHLVTEGQRRLAILAEEAGRRALELGPPDPDPLFDPAAERATGTPDQAALDRLAERAAGVLAAAEVAVAAAQAHLEDHQATATHVATLAERWDRARQAARERVQLASGATAVDAIRTRLELGQQAEQVRPSLQAAEVAADARRQVDRAADRHLRRAAAARDGLHRPVPDLTDLPLHRLPSALEVAAARRAVAVEAGELEAAAALHARLAEARQGAAEQHATAAQNLALAAEGAAEVARLREAATRAAAALATATTARDRLDGLAAAALHAEESAAAAVRLHAVRARRALAEADVVTAGSLVNAAWSAQLDLRSAYLDGIAAVLAQGLQPDQPCQVCGATDHPDPAQAADDAVTLAQVEQAEEASNAARAEADRCKEVVAELARLEAVEAAAAGAADADPETAHDHAANARHKWHVAHELAASVTHRQAALARLTDQADELEALADAARTVAHQAGSGAEQQEATARALAAELASVVGPAVDPAAASEALHALDTALVALAERAGSCDQARQAQDAAEARLAADLAASPFADLPELRAALLAPEERQALAAQVEHHDLRWATVLDTLADPSWPTSPPSAPTPSGPPPR